MNHFEEVELGGVMCLRSKSKASWQTWTVIGMFAAVIVAVILSA